ncbi:MAG: tandem-95 repeat protein [Phycisphaera sp.]|nr:tandem-95 repeat protein [Phycisphaera sp.]
MLHAFTGGCEMCRTIRLFNRLRSRRVRRRRERRRDAHRLTPALAVIELLEQRLLMSAVTAVSLSPEPNSQTADRYATVVATFDQTLNAATVTEDTFVVQTLRTARLLDANGGVFTLTTEDATVTLQSGSDWRAGEIVQVTITGGIENPGGEGATPYVYQFRVTAENGTGVFNDSGQTLGNAATSRVELGDFNGDSYFDIFETTDVGNRVWLNANDGSGVFTDTMQSLGSAASTGVALGDLDGDGDVDAFVVNGGTAGDTVWLNDGSGVFTDSMQSLGASDSRDVALGDLDGDGDLDALVTYVGASDRIWLNDGSGVFTATAQKLGGSVESVGVAMGDLDGDGDLDAFVAKADGGDPVWLNDGSGTFASNGQSLTMNASRDVEIGDLDGDGDLDVVVATDAGLILWTNDGSAQFTQHTQTVTDAISALALGDLDADGDLDLFVSFTDDKRVLLNDGTGAFSASGAMLGGTASASITLGDIDLDGDIDAVTANSGAANRVWVNFTNTAPDTIGDAYEVDEDNTLTVTDALGVLANDSDVDDGQTLTAVLQQDVSHGTLTLNADGSFTYTPDANYHGPDSFIYVANDGTDDSNGAVVTLTIHSVNDPVVAVDDGVFVVPYGAPLAFNGPLLLQNDTDADIDAVLAVTAADNAVGGQLDVRLGSEGRFNEAVPGDANRFGRSVAVDGDWAMVGAPDYASNGGAVTVFHRDEAGWAYHSTLVGSGAFPVDFGHAIDLDGDRAIISDYREGPGGARIGAAYVFELVGGSWVEQVRLAPAGNDLDFFGLGVSIDGDWVAVGASEVDLPSKVDAGAVYMYHFDGDHWGESAQLTPDDSAAGQLFGNVVELRGDDLLVGAYHDSGAANDAGAVYAFTRQQDTWTQSQKLVASDAHSGHSFGYRLDAQGDRLVVGTVLDNSAGARSGAVYVFDRTDGVWAESVKLVGSDVSTNSYFGFGVALVGNRLFVAAPQGDPNNFSQTNTVGAGRVYEFAYDGAWVEVRIITADDAAFNAKFGSDIAADADTLIVGSLEATIDSDVTGAAYIYSPSIKVTFTPDMGYYGPASFRYTASDGLTTDTATVSLRVNAPPAATDDDYAVDQQTPLVVASGQGVLANDDPVDGDDITAVLVGDVAHGTLALNADGSFTYTPDDGFYGADSFTYQATDGVDNSGVVTVNIDVRINLDIDGVGTVQPLTDGILVIRSLAGFTGDVLITGALGAGATRTTGESVAAFLVVARDLFLDVDGDGLLQPLTDGILLLRYLAGFTGDVLVTGATGAGATRTTGQQIVDFLDPFQPPVAPPPPVFPETVTTVDQTPPAPQPLLVESSDTTPAASPAPAPPTVDLLSNARAIAAANDALHRPAPAAFDFDFTPLTPTALAAVTNLGVIRARLRLIDLLAAPAGPAAPLRIDPPAEGPSP